MKSIARRVEGYTHEVEVNGHTIVSDEPADKGGNDEGPSPSRLLIASLAACTATTVEMYADRKGWELGAVEVEAELVSAERDEPARYSVEVRIPAPLTDEQAERIKVIAGKCPVHRILTGEVEIEDRVEVAPIR
ncbi:MAG: OsmC family protein [Solirubrobacterales bacterium]